MEQGNTTTVVPNEGQVDPNVSQQDANDPQEGSQNGKSNLEAEFAVLKERYSHSSTEGKRLADELKRANERLQALETQRSLKNEEVQQQDSFPSEEQYVRYWVENGDKTEKEARLEWRDKHIVHQNQMALMKGQEALIKRLTFEAELREKQAINNNPEAEKAQEFFKDVPEIASLPVIEQINRYKQLTKNFAVKPEGRDLSEVKRAASGIGPGTASAGQSNPNAQLDNEAKKNGYPSWKIQEEFRKCQTAEEHFALKQKYKLKF